MSTENLDNNEHLDDSTTPEDTEGHLSRRIMSLDTDEDTEGHFSAR